MSFDKIPAEMRGYKQWVLWRLEFRPPMAKPTKPLYIAEAGRGKANVNEAGTWRDFEAVTAAPLTCTEPVDPDTPISETGYSGIGFVFTPVDPFTGIDLDDTQGDQEAYARQLNIYHTFNSYTELSPSGSGVHIIVKGSLPTGRRRHSVEIYSEGRYFTMTGNVINNVPIAERQDLLNILWSEMGGEPVEFDVHELKDEQHTDEQVLEIARNASNSGKFQKLYSGDWQTEYSSQSEADFALYDIIAYYSKHRLQCRRLFRASMLGQRDKAQRDRYCDYMFEKSFDNQLAPLDIDGFKIKFDEMLAAQKAKDAAAAESVAEPGRLDAHSTPAAAPTLAGNPGLNVGNHLVNGKSTLPGLLGRISDYIFASAARPVRTYADAGSIALLAGLTGRSFNISGTGLNQYILMLGGTGTGKDAVASAINKLFNEIAKTAPAIHDFKGAGELVSAPGIAKSFINHPAKLFVVGEIGKKLHDMVAPFANSSLRGISRLLLTFYSKSGHGEQSDAMAYSDKANNVSPVESPSLTLIGEGVPSTVYDHLDDTMINDGLMPRFLVFEHGGDRLYFNYNRVIDPPFDLVQDLSNLTATCLAIASQRAVNNVPMSTEAHALFDQYDRYTTDVINASRTEGIVELWNRAHLKALKLAALAAVGENIYNPHITIDNAQWATELVSQQIIRLAAKFEAGEVGNHGASESKQLAELCKIVGRYNSKDWLSQSKYGGTEEMHKQGIILECHIQRRTACLACFRHDRMGATAAMKRTLKMLLDFDDMREISGEQMMQRFGTKSKAYVISNPQRFIEV